jgi:hypothetical protein
MAEFGEEEVIFTHVRHTVFILMFTLIVCSFLRFLWRRSCKSHSTICFPAHLGSFTKFYQVDWSMYDYHHELKRLIAFSWCYMQM